MRKEEAKQITRDRIALVKELILNKEGYNNILKKAFPRFKESPNSKSYVLRFVEKHLPSLLEDYRKNSGYDIRFNQKKENIKELILQGKTATEILKLIYPKTKRPINSTHLIYDRVKKEYPELELTLRENSKRLYLKVEDRKYKDSEFAKSLRSKMPKEIVVQYEFPEEEKQKIRSRIEEGYKPCEIIKEFRPDRVAKEVIYDLHKYVKVFLPDLYSTFSKNARARSPFSDPDEKLRHKRNVNKLLNRKILQKDRWFYAQIQARRRGLSWNIPEDLYQDLIKRPCEYCNEALAPFGYGLDRCDSLLGYEIDNVVPCCKKCNRVKSNRLSYDETKYAMSMVSNFRSDPNTLLRYKREIVFRSYSEDKINEHWILAQKITKKRNKIWNLTLEEYSFLLKQTCFYCKTDLLSKGTNAVCLDRIDNNLGYEVDNVVTSCGTCNIIRFNAITHEETIIFIGALYEFRTTTRESSK